MSDLGLEDVSTRVIGDGSAPRTGVRVSEDSPISIQDDRRSK